ncbi:Glu/Leu/Phe/Val family dehydrogenase [Sedimenticola hydrogenitrophicus]|uniref:Glu/Leu/Phe/Val family dehydrogenase n=1 Tax=Sedimenticola hydrogenitrophicus TaxID=2967975 RepID=UPI0021A7C451|nr:Glu/Leu/Phe/Val dehydrogenase [Sedimenticola hydrogenitrophicus]
MSEAFDQVDELGPAKIIHVYEPTHQLKAILVVDNVACGPAIGGLRMAPDVSTRECARLARAMTLKNAAAGLDHGGAKSVLFGDPKMPREQKEPLIRAFACAVRGNEEYIFGPDMGTDESCMAWVRDELGGRAVGLPRALGGIPLDELGATAWGLSSAVDAALEHVDFRLDGARLVIQGFGSVGLHAARFLLEKGAVLVAAADSRGATYHPDGLDLDELIRLKGEGASVASYPKGEKLARDAVVGIACDIWIPAARPDVVHAGNVGLMDTRLVVQGANIPFTSEAETALHQRGVLVIPDFIANAGGVICGAMEYRHMSQKMAFEAIAEKVSSNTAGVLERSAREKIPPREAAVAMAGERVRRAMQTRRWSIF